MQVRSCHSVRSHSAGAAGARYGLALQLDAHDSCVEDSELEFLGAALLLTVGGYYRGGSGWRFEFGVTEDVRVGASPDVAFYFGIRLAALRCADLHRRSGRSIGTIGNSALRCGE